MPQELFSVIEHCQGDSLLLRRSYQQQAHMRPAKIRRNKHFGDGRRAHTRVGELVPNQLLQFLAKAFGDSFVPMRIQLSG